MKPKLELPDILERLPKKPRKNETFNFLLLCSPVKDPGVDISNCEDPPFLALSVDFPPKGGDPVIISAKPLYFIDGKWTKTPAPEVACAMQTEFLTMDILSALHQRVMLIENKLM